MKSGISSLHNTAMLRVFGFFFALFFRLIIGNTCNVTFEPKLNGFIIKASTELKCKTFYKIAFKYD